MDQPQPRPRGTRRDADGQLRYRATGPSPRTDQRLSALPSPAARALAFCAILLAGACGALIGYGVVRVQYPTGHVFAKSVAATVGALVSAIGVAVLAVLVLRAMGEWNRKAIDVDRVHLGDDRSQNLT